MRPFFKKRTAAAALFLAAGLLSPAISVAASSAPERGTWHWTGSRDSDPFGSAAVVGNPEQEQAVLEIYRRWNIVRVYTAHSRERLRRDADAIARWNARLEADGRSSWILFSTTGWIFEDQRDNLRRALRESVIGFNASRERSEERFVGVHFDVEPQILPEWKTATPERKREMLQLLADMYTDARAFLDANDGQNLPIRVALPVWVDRLPPALGGTGGIGWESEAQRDQWFEQVGKAVEGISLMAFETPYVRSILNNAAWEMEHFAGDVRIALRADLGQEWNKIEEMLTAMAAVEKGAGHGIELQPFRWFARKAGHMSPEDFLPR